VQHLLQRPHGEYGLTATSVLKLHMGCCEGLLSHLLSADVLARVEAQRAACADESRRPSSVHVLLETLFFGGGGYRGLGHPLNLNSSSDFAAESLVAELNAAAEDALSAQALLAAARLVNKLCLDKGAHALVQAQAKALAKNLTVNLSQYLKPDTPQPKPVACEHWRGVLDALKKKDQNNKDDAESSD